MKRRSSSNYVLTSMTFIFNRFKLYINFDSVSNQHFWLKINVIDEIRRVIYWQNETYNNSIKQINDNQNPFPYLTKITNNNISNNFVHLLSLQIIIELQQ